MTGSSKIYFKGKHFSLSELTREEHDRFELKAKKAIAQSLGKKTVKVVHK